MLARRLRRLAQKVSNEGGWRDERSGAEVKTTTTRATSRGNELAIAGAFKLPPPPASSRNARAPADMHRERTEMHMRGCPRPRDFPRFSSLKTQHASPARSMPGIAPRGTC